MVTKSQGTRSLQSIAATKTAIKRKKKKKRGPACAAKSTVVMRISQQLVSHWLSDSWFTMATKH